MKRRRFFTASRMFGQSARGSRPPVGAAGAETCGAGAGAAGGADWAGWYDGWGWAGAARPGPSPCPAP